MRVPGTLEIQNRWKTLTTPVQASYCGPTLIVGRPKMLFNSHLGQNKLHNDTTAPSRLIIAKMLHGACAVAVKSKDPKDVMIKTPQTLFIRQKIFIKFYNPSPRLEK